MADNLKLVFTFMVAILVVGGGMAMLFFTRLDPPEADVQGLRLLLAGFIGIALQWTFGRETATATARQVERGFAAQPTATVTSGPPATATVTPADPIP